jgi:quinol monooxygenase YgiN
MRRIIRVHNVASQIVGLPADTPPKHAARGRDKYVARDRIINAQANPLVLADAYCSTRGEYKIPNEHISEDRHTAHGHDDLYAVESERYKAAVKPDGADNLRRVDVRDRVSVQGQAAIPGRVARPIYPSSNVSPRRQPPNWSRDFDQRAIGDARQRSVNWVAPDGREPRLTTVRSGSRPGPSRSYTGRVRPYGRMLIFSLMDDKVVDFDRLAEQTAREVVAREPGTLVYAIHFVPNAPLQRIFYEIYRDLESFNVHERQPHMRHFVAKWRSYAFSAEIVELRLTYAMISPLPNAQASRLPPQTRMDRQSSRF